MNSGNEIRALLFLALFPRGWRLSCIRVLALLLVVLMFSSGSFAYSVLTHEEIVDLVWADEMRPLLLKRFPELSEDQLKEAHAYAYGGAVIQDLGYYPFGSVEFSNLVHYVRTGDFVRQLIAAESGCQRICFCTRRSRTLCVRHCWPPRCQRSRCDALSEAAGEVR